MHTVPNALSARRPARLIALLLALLLAGSAAGCTFRLGRQTAVSPVEPTESEASHPEREAAPEAEAVPDAPLSDAELQWFRNKVLNERSLGDMMLTSTYTDARDVDLSRLFYNGIPGAGNTVTEEERAALAELDASAEHLDIIKVTRAQMDEALQALVGCTLAETTQRGLDQFLYLADYDAYYLVHSDALDARCELSGVRRADGTVTLLCTGSLQTTAATLVETDDGWRIVSNLEVSEETAR